LKRFNTIFSKPSTDSKPWAVWVWNLTVCRDELNKQLTWLIEQGFGGIAVLPGRDMAPAFLSGEFLDYFGVVLKACREHGLGVRLATDFSLPWTTGLETEMWRKPSYRASRLSLERTDAVEGKGKCALAVAEPELAIVLATRMSEGKVASPADVRVLQPVKGVLNWTAPPGEWQVQVLRKRYDCDPSGNHLPNAYSSELAQAYTTRVLNVLRSRFARYMGGTFKGIVAEMPDQLPADKSIPWDDDLIIKYRSKYKKDLIKLLPIVFSEADDSLLKNRSHVHHYLMHAMYERFAAVVETWMRKHHLSQWVLSAERNQSGANMLRHFAALPETSLSAAGIQCQEGLEDSYPVARAMADMNAVQFRRTTLAVVGRSQQRFAGNLQSLKTEIDLALTSGATHVLVDGFCLNLDQRMHDKAGLSPSWYSPDAAGMKSLVAYATALRETFRGVRTAPQAAVLLPSASAVADYLPGRDEALRQAAAQLRRVVRHLREQNVCFDVVSEEFLLSCSVRQNGEFGSGDRVRKGNYQALIVPYARLISKSLLVFVEKLAVRKGMVVFTDEAPQGDLDDGSSRAFSARIEKMLELRKGAIHVAASRELQPVLSALAPAGVVLVNGTPCAELQVSAAEADGCDIYFVRNTSATQDYHASLSIPQRRNICIVNCATSEIVEAARVEQHDGRSLLPLCFAPLQTHLIMASSAKPPLTKLPKERRATAVLLASTNRDYRMVLKNQWSFSPVSPNVLPLATWNTRIGLSRESGGYSHFYEGLFSIKELPQRCWLVLSGINPPLSGAAGVERSVEVSVNGAKVNLLPATQPDSEGVVPASDASSSLFLRDQLVCSLRSCINRGVNRVIVRASGFYGHPPAIVYPPLVVGDFSIKKDAAGWVIDEPTQEIGHDTWTLYGFPHLSGLGEYRHVFEVPSKYNRLVIRLSRVTGSVNVHVNDVEAGTLFWQPMELDVTALCTHKRNDLKLRIANTVDNILRLNARPSGLLGEVYVDVY
jgi:hypothetical protein